MGTEGKFNSGAVIPSKPVAPKIFTSIPSWRAVVEGMVTVITLLAAVVDNGSFVRSITTVEVGLNLLRIDSLSALRGYGYSLKVIPELRGVAVSNQNRPLML